MSVDVYGFADDTYLYVAYKADKTEPGWALAESLCVGANFYFSTVKDGNLLDTVFHMENPGETWQVMQTEDWVTWVELGTLEANGVEYEYTSMWDSPDNQGVAELKIPLSLIVIEGANQIELYGQYWQYDWSELFYVELPPSVVTATVDIDPNTLNLKSKGKWITCYIELPEGYDVADIDISSIQLNDISAESRPATVGDYDGDGVSDLMVKFKRSEIVEILSPGDTVELTITGELTDGTPFEGADMIRVIEKGKT
ncbi:hypothetical protein J7L06_00285 [Candidatus Bathyarchaeota archaeon]|nr:hypothetical protein [Candidatus Bathyarchaeota archaeon]